ncbi:MAG: hypothetical protein AAGN46_11415 [Acidobacteriota bacterium]
MRRRLPRFVLPIVLAMVSTAAVADVLVLRDGSRIEIDGTWEERGRLIRFTTTDGQLSSVRASEVDLEASAEATRAAQEATARAATAEEEPAADAERPEPVLVLTDQDIARAQPDVVAEAEDEVQEGNLEVVTWTYDPAVEQSDAGYIITGRLRNNGATDVSSVQLFINLRGKGRDGEVIEGIQITGRAELDANRLAAGQEIAFVYDVLREDLAKTGNPGLFQDPKITFDARFDREGQDERVEQAVSN